jgi:hypothetical protein
MAFDHDVLIRGTNTFEYESDSTATINASSQLHLDSITFEYAPTRNNHDLLAMIDQSSRLFIDGVTLESTTTGMRLTKGTLVIDHKNYLVNTGATSVSQGIIFGDGTADHDLHLEFKPGGSITQLSGVFDYQNVDAAVI